MFDFSKEGFVDFLLNVWLEKEEIKGCRDLLVLVGDFGIFCCGNSQVFMVIERMGGVLIDTMENGSNGLGQFLLDFVVMFDFIDFILDVDELVIGFGFQEAFLGLSSSNGCHLWVDGYGLIVLIMCKLFVIGL